LVGQNGDGEEGEQKVENMHELDGPKEIFPEGRLPSAW